jgi:DNA-binding transcriptional LysR family regulator
MELGRLRYFAAVGQALNFTKAAMPLHVAQPALSRQVSDLEDELAEVAPALKCSSTLNSWL